MAVTLSACGIAFSSDFTGTEVFRGLHLDSDFRAGSPIAVELTVSVNYPVPLAISCRYEDTHITDDQRAVAFNERTTSVFETVLPAQPGEEPSQHNPGETRTFNFQFSVPKPGDYFVACFTVASPENGIGQGFTITQK
jgi:hypothetical protein